MHGIIATVSSFVGFVLLAVSAIILAVRLPRASTRMAAMGFVIASLAQLVSNVAPQQVKYIYTDNIVSAADVQMGAVFDVSRYFFAAGFLLGGSGLLWFSCQVFAPNNSLKSDVAKPPALG